MATCISPLRHDALERPVFLGQRSTLSVLSTLGRGQVAAQTHAVISGQKLNISKDLKQ